MKLSWFFFCSALFFLLPSCGDSGNASIASGNGDTASENAATTNTPAAPATAPAKPVREKHGCEIIGKVIEDTEFWIAEEELLFVIIADTAEFYDNDYPDSYRSFQIYDTKKCDLIGNHVMPVNQNPEYPYYLYPQTLEPNNRVICAQGSDFVYCYDLQRKEMLMPMIPEYRSKRRASDATSGLPQGLKIWGNYLFGYAVDFGTYAFDLRNKQRIKNFLPLGEYLDKDSGAMNQLFMHETESGAYQALYSSFDYDAGDDALSIQPLFEKPLPVSIRLPASARNNNLLVFKYKDGSNAVGVDMAKGTRVDLPAEVASQSVQEIISWMKAR